LKISLYSQTDAGVSTIMIADDIQCRKQNPPIWSRRDSM